MIVNMSQIYVGIITYNSESDIVTCLESLSQQDYPDLSVIILDNASTDQSVECVQQYNSNIHLIQNTTNVGFASGHNQIVADCQPGVDDYYMTLNPDVVLSANYISMLVAELKIQKASWGTGKLLLPNKTHIYSTGHALLKNGYAFNIGYGLPDGETFETSREVFGAPGAAAIYAGHLIEQLPLFDGNMFLYYEDVDLDWRAQLKGLRCWYCAAATATHRGSTPGPELRVQAIANRYRSVLKNACPTSLLLYNVPTIIIHILLRLILTPGLGIQLAAGIWKHARDVINKRTPFTQSTCKSINSWFQWSSQQPSSTPHSLFDRWSAFWHK